jgi:hypothetical protein
MEALSRNRQEVRDKKAELSPIDYVARFPAYVNGSQPQADPRPFFLMCFS